MRTLVICLAQCSAHCKCVALLSSSSSYHYHHGEGDRDGRLRRCPGWRGDKEELSLTGTSTGKSGTQAFFVSLFHPYTYSLFPSLSLSPGLPPEGAFFQLISSTSLSTYTGPIQHPFPHQGVFIQVPLTGRGEECWWHVYSSSRGWGQGPLKGLAFSLVGR